jgi:DNA polymerase elongation subunit (family B)|tara:strand:- start:2110 stop:3510 length:1401 start_codon:yes stop_codon:yes gene_type:complete
MLLDIEQTDKELIVSYYNKEGKVSFKRYPVSKFENWAIAKDNDKYKDQNLTNWDGRPIKKSISRSFNKFSLLYFMDSLSEADRDEIYEFNMPRTYFVDIETEIVDGFPKPEEAKSRILSFSIITPERKAIVLGLEDMSPAQIKKLEEDTNAHFKDYDQDWEFSYYKFKDEYNMLYTFLHKFLPKFPMMTGWNFINYDWQYIVNRCKRLQIDLTQVAITGALDKKDSRPLHMGILDYMQLYDKYDRSVAVKESNSLDFVSGAVLDVKKIKFTGGLQELYENNFAKYIYYNVVDSCLVYYIDEKLRSMEVLLTLATITKMPLYKAASPVAVTESLFARKLAEDNKKIAVEYNKESIKDTKYEGAFVKQPIVGYYSGVSAFDFASLYPSVMRQFNISPDSFVEMIPTLDVKERRKDDSIIVCENGAVYNKEDSMLKIILADLYGQRKDYKKTSYTYYEKAYELKKKFKI